MSEVETLLNRARAHAARSGASLSTVSRKLLGNGKRLDQLAAGGSLRVDTLHRAMDALSEMERTARKAAA